MTSLEIMVKMLEERKRIADMLDQASKNVGLADKGISGIPVGASFVQEMHLRTTYGYAFYLYGLPTGDAQLIVKLVDIIVEDLTKRLKDLDTLIDAANQAINVTIGDELLTALTTILKGD